MVIMLYVQLNMCRKTVKQNWKQSACFLTGSPISITGVATACIKITAEHILNCRAYIIFRKLQSSGNKESGQMLFCSRIRCMGIRGILKMQAEDRSCEAKRGKVVVLNY